MDMNEVKLAFATAVPIDDVDELRMSPTMGFAIVWIDIQDRPDLAILQSKDKPLDGYSVISWFYATEQNDTPVHIGLHLQMKSPVKFALSVVFPIKKYRSQLQAIARHGHIWFVVGPPPDHLIGAQEMTAQQFMRKVVAHTGNGLLVELEPHLIDELRQKL